MQELLSTVPQVGRLEWIGLAPAHRAPIEVVSEAIADALSGLRGDHRAQRGPGSTRQVTLIQAEHLPVVALLCGRSEVGPELLRRNLVVAGINLLSLKGRRFRIGEVLLEGQKECPPCSRMEEALGPGGYQAMRGHGGVTAVVLEGGVLRRGDAVRAE